MNKWNRREFMVGITWLQHYNIESIVYLWKSLIFCIKTYGIPGYAGCQLTCVNLVANSTAKFVLRDETGATDRHIPKRATFLFADCATVSTSTHKRTHDFKLPRCAHTRKHTSSRIPVAHPPHNAERKQKYVFLILIARSSQHSRTRTRLQVVRSSHSIAHNTRLPVLCSSHNTANNSRIQISRLRVRLTHDFAQSTHVFAQAIAQLSKAHTHVARRNFVNNKFRVAYTFILQYHVLPFLFLSALIRAYPWSSVLIRAHPTSDTKCKVLFIDVYCLKVVHRLILASRILSFL